MAQTATPTIVGGSTGLAVITDDPLYTFTPEKLDPELVSEHTTPETDIGRVAERFVYEIYRVSGFCKESERGVVEETEPWRPGSALSGPKECSAVRKNAGEPWPVGLRAHACAWALTRAGINR